MTSFYEVLGVPVTATSAEIRQAYISQSLKFHPDRNFNVEAKKQFQQIAEAYFTLSDPERRNAYDREHTTHLEDLNPLQVFAGVFDDLLVPEVPNRMFLFI